MRGTPTPLENSAALKRRPTGVGVLTVARGFSPASRGQYDFADVQSALDEPMGVGGALERKCARDDRREPPRRELADQHVHQRRKLAALFPQMTDVEAEHAAVAIDHRHRVETRRRDPGME